MNSDFWKRPLSLARNNFKDKSLSCWSANIAVGCAHGCGFCYVPEVSTRRMKPALAPRGVQDPDSEWGSYVFLRSFDREKWRREIAKAEATPASELNPDGNRAVMFCTTTDPYQVITNPDPTEQRRLNRHLMSMMEQALTDLLERSSLNVRILTRSPLAALHFDLFKKFGPRLLFGVSLPTLDVKLSRLYEAKSPSPSRRVDLLRLAESVGLNTYIAAAPTFPGMSRAEMEAILLLARETKASTVFMEPINIRAQNVQRLRERARMLGLPSDPLQVFDSTESWVDYSAEQMTTFADVAQELGLDERLFLWPDPDLRTRSHPRLTPDFWRAWTGRISYWPTP